MDKLQLEQDLLQQMLDLPAEHFPYLRQYSIYHIQGIWWLKEKHNEVYSHDRKLGDFHDAVNELDKLTKHLMLIERIPPPVVFRYDELNEEIRLRILEYFKLPVGLLR